MSRRSAGALLASPLLLVLLLAFVGPALFMLPLSLREYVPGSGMGPGYTLANYTRLATDPFYREVILRSLGLGLSVTVLCLLLGYPLAWVIAHARPRLKLALTLLVIFPMLLNLVVRSFGWIALLSNRGLLNNALMDLGLIERPLKLMFNLTGVLVGMAHIFLPFMVLMLVPVIQAVPRDLRDAAYTLQAGRLRTFLSVTLPLTAHGILAGSIMVFVLTISALVTPRMLGGPTYKVMATMIYDDFLLTLDWPSGAAMAFTLTALTLAVIGVSSRMLKRWGGEP
ncbi:ABC transporter permease [Achromobacter denitrificans]|uniref:ABC transporter permease n=1 Tax=Achromobacter denitrificans TaxID=32002 RepID=UPI000B4D8548|nr:ABC transporter permease [Achromobacter denitrificans]ASC68236.1 ABC transporter permease [Achromobacter denitrificans]MBV2159136.1 ABC transporter permease [Achromobacter denitrificans]MDX3882088.1 ABC transporter permease [Achromobacter sp.]WFC65977.1 ABC transporter permease [Achromobacter denitrificans]